VHEAVFHCLDDPFFGPKTPAPGHAVDTVLEEAELGPSAANDPAVSFRQVLGIDGHMDGLHPPDFGRESKLIHHHIIEYGKDGDDVFKDDHLFLQLLEVGR